MIKKSTIEDLLCEKRNDLYRLKISPPWLVRQPFFPCYNLFRYLSRIPNVNLTPEGIAQMIDLSAVRAESDDSEIRRLVDCARQYHTYLVTVLPAQVKTAKRLLAGNTAVKLGGNVGFPSGGQTTHIKAQETNELVSLGCDEIDMVLDLAALISGRDGDVLQDICAVIEAAAGCPVKVILECHYLNECQVRQACDMAIQAGAAFVKTGTGWAPAGATLETITLIKNHVGEQIKIKASGGIRDLETLLEMYRLGASRFGISHRSGRVILEELFQSGGAGNA
jgi:deoxyribose-phosphate aldolase